MINGNKLIVRIEKNNDKKITYFINAITYCL